MTGADTRDYLAEMRQAWEDYKQMEARAARQQKRAERAVRHLTAMSQTAYQASERLFRAYCLARSRAMDAGVYHPDDPTLSDDDMAEWQDRRDEDRAVAGELEWLDR